MTSYDKSAPAEGDYTSAGDNEIRDGKAANQEINHIDHFWPWNVNVVDNAERGMHQRITFINPANVVAEIVTPGTNQAFLITKIDTNPELYFTNNGGSLVQLTVKSGAVTVLNVTAAAIAAADTNIVDSDTLTHTAGVLSLKAGGAGTGILKGHLGITAKDFVDEVTIENDATNGLQAKVPAVGAGADAPDDTFLPCAAYGTYTGTGVPLTITAFDSATQKIRHVVIRGNKATATDGGAEALKNDAGTTCWAQKGQEVNLDLTITDNTFVLGDADSKLNKSGSIYSWIAYGEWIT